MVKPCSAISDQALAKLQHWSSSGLGDDLVIGPRAQRFEAIVNNSEMTQLRAAQDTFHADQTGDNSRDLGRDDPQRRAHRIAHRC